MSGARDFSWLPAVLAEIAEVAGLPAALRLARERGGTEAHIPASAPDGHWLVRCLGREGADLICDHFRSGGQGQSVNIPQGPMGTAARRSRIADRMIRDGRWSAREIALAVGITERTVHRRRARLASAPDPRQEDLFADLPRP